jgi:hypothetical protein
MPKMNAILAASAALSAALVAQASAQPIAVGGSTTGTLAQSDARNEERSSFMDAYQITLAAGQSVDIRMNSDEFDTYLFIGQQHQGGFEAYDQNDDFGGTLNSRLRFSAPEAGTYTIQATSFGSETTGNYSLSVAETVIVPPPTPIALGAGATVSGSFGAVRPTLDETGQPYALYTYEASEGEMVTFSMASDTIDSYMEIGLDTEWGYEPYMAGGDFEGDMGAQMVFRFPEAGVYTLRAMGLDAEAQGAFTLTATPFVAAPEPRPTRLRMNAIVRGALEEGEPVNANMQYYDVYSLNVREGQEVRITMRATEGEEYFDPFLEVGMNTPLGFAAAAMDDDSGGGINGLDAQVSFTAESSGTLIIRATGLVPMTGGAYSISVE